MRARYCGGERTSLCQAAAARVPLQVVFLRL